MAQRVTSNGAPQPSAAIVAAAAPPRALLQPAEFFELTDQVLVEFGREPFASDGAQRAIIEVRPDDRVLQILAGPGSGKTEVLVWRVLYELLVGGSESANLLVTTFTRRAATELSVRLVERSDTLLRIAHDRGIEVSDPRVHDLRVGTLHSLCDELMAEFDTAYMEAGTQLIDEIETRVRLIRDRNWLFRDGVHPSLVERILGSEELVALFHAPWFDDSRPVNVMAQVELLMSILNHETETWIPRATSGLKNGVEAVHGIPQLTDDLALLQEKWEGYLDDQRVLDFATLQKRFLDRQGSIGDLRHVFVDEFQDTNPIQFAIHRRWLERDGVRLTVVGDDDQSLYRFRGSDIDCFAQLGPECHAASVAYRREVLGENWRSTKAIVSFTRAYRDETILADLSLEKTLVAPASAADGAPVRLLEASWAELCDYVAEEIDQLGAGRPPANGEAPPSVGILFFSTSELESRTSTRPAQELHDALAGKGVRVYNPRNKTAGRPGSAVHDLLGLISYLVDPVTMEPIGKNNRMVEVWASRRDERSPFAASAEPEYPMSQAHSAIQRRLIKATGAIGTPGPELQPLLAYLDEIRTRLVDATETFHAGKGNQPRLSLAGLIARLLAMEYFRSSGFSVEMFRQALFTKLLEANVAPTRLTRDSLDGSMLPSRDEHGKIVWPKQFWRLLNVFGMLLDGVKLDDLEVESFSENAVAMLTFHQAKGLEFDHVYVGLTGREPDVSPVLQTMLFSGKEVDYYVEDGHAISSDPEAVRLATADREREIYVALTRAKRTLTVLHAPEDKRPLMALNPGLAAVFTSAGHAQPLPSRPSVRVTEAGP